MPTLLLSFTPLSTQRNILPIASPVGAATQSPHHPFPNAQYVQPFPTHSTNTQAPTPYTNNQTSGQAWKQRGIVDGGGVKGEVAQRPRPASNEQGLQVASQIMSAYNSGSSSSMGMMEVTLENQARAIPYPPPRVLQQYAYNTTFAQPPHHSQPQHSLQASQVSPGGTASTQYGLSGGPVSAQARHQTGHLYGNGSENQPGNAQPSGPHPGVAQTTENGAPSVQWGQADTTKSLYGPNGPAQAGMPSGTMSGKQLENAQPLVLQAAFAPSVPIGMAPFPWSRASQPGQPVTNTNGVPFSQSPDRAQPPMHASSVAPETISFPSVAYQQQQRDHPGIVQMPALLAQPQIPRTSSPTHAIPRSGAPSPTATPTPRATSPAPYSGDLFARLTSSVTVSNHSVPAHILYAVILNLGGIFRIRRDVLWRQLLALLRLPDECEPTFMDDFCGTNVAKWSKKTAEVVSHKYMTELRPMEGDLLRSLMVGYSNTLTRVGTNPFAPMEAQPRADRGSQDRRPGSARSMTSVHSQQGPRKARSHPSPTLNPPVQLAERSPGPAARLSSYAQSMTYSITSAEQRSEMTMPGSNPSTPLNLPAQLARRSIGSEDRCPSSAPSIGPTFSPLDGWESTPPVDLDKASGRKKRKSLAPSQVPDDTTIASHSQPATSGSSRRNSKRNHGSGDDNGESAKVARMSMFINTDAAAYRAELRTSEELVRKVSPRSSRVRSSPGEEPAMPLQLRASDHSGADTNWPGGSYAFGSESAGPTLPMPTSPTSGAVRDNGPLSGDTDGDNSNDFPAINIQPSTSGLVDPDTAHTQDWPSLMHAPDTSDHQDTTAYSYAVHLPVHGAYAALDGEHDAQFDSQELERLWNAMAHGGMDGSLEYALGGSSGDGQAGNAPAGL